MFRAPSLLTFSQSSNSLRRRSLFGKVKMRKKKMHKRNNINNQSSLSIKKSKFNKSKWSKSLSTMIQLRRSSSVSTPLLWRLRLRRRT
jgi:hypothetical protein